MTNENVTESGSTIQNETEDLVKAESHSGSRRTFVFSGGGAYAVAEFGIVEYILEKNLFNPSSDLAIGTSFGAISAGSLALNLRDNTLLDMLSTFNEKASTYLSSWSLAWAMLSFPYTLGLDNLEMILAPYFGEDTHSANQSLITVATDMTTWQPVYITDSLRQSKKISILESIAASASIPLVFTPVKIADNICIDGGIMNNFPVNAANNASEIYAFGSPLGTYVNTNPASTLGSYLSNLLNGAIYRLNKDTQRYVHPLIAPKVKYCEYTTHATNILDFSHFEEDYQAGYETAKEWFSSLPTM